MVSGIGGVWVPSNYGKTAPATVKADAGITVAEADNPLKTRKDGQAELYDLKDDLPPRIVTGDKLVEISEKSPINNISRPIRDTLKALARQAHGEEDCAHRAVMATFWKVTETETGSYRVQLVRISFSKDSYQKLAAAADSTDYFDELREWKDNPPEFTLSADQIRKNLPAASSDLDKDTSFYFMYM